jgi:hypothetical protein
VGGYSVNCEVLEKSSVFSLDACRGNTVGNLALLVIASEEAAILTKGIPENSHQIPSGSRTQLVMGPATRLAHVPKPCPEIRRRTCHLLEGQ